ncbi:3-deoxy-D-manno-octulosonic acid kinase [Mergibacter septicus]|uniref:3-deoxy-D-manno-octulosonic acid kinase n=1 Tax=Mergibacter septicus TaxID=221402 RepID=UPI00117933EA|nr:3-deoxy-D-manno-octulosonic acid kinase [Mergibacter septicus]AWX14312.1 3-deoxy-D-manno-octulosonic acid kinase [Mergibacter septicus]
MMTKKIEYLFQPPLQAVKDEWFQPVAWYLKNRVVATAKGRGVTWFLESQDLFGINAVLRHYYRGGMVGKFVKDRYYFQHLELTRSFAEFRLLQYLYQQGLPVPYPIAARVIKQGCFYQADILLQRIENAQDLTKVLQQAPLRKDVWYQIGQLIHQLHHHQVCHTDLNAHNILLQQQDKTIKLWLIDFDKCRIRQGEKWKAENLARLHRSFHKEAKRMQIHFGNADWQQLLKGYYA